VKPTRVLSSSIGSSGSLRVVGGLGAELTLSDGRTVIDAMTTPAPLGHRHPRLVEAVAAAVRDSPTLDEGWESADREAAADELLETAFAGEDSWVGAVRFAVTGSEANDLALSLCQALTGRRPLVTRDRAYHGMVGLAREVTVQPQWHGGLTETTGRFSPVPRSTPVRTLPFPEGVLGSGLDLSREQARTTLAGAGPVLEDAAAVIIDYSQGGRYAAPAYQDELAGMARAAGVLWIADEVVTGFGKCGQWFNFQWGESRPDIVTLGKPMGGGVAPVAAVVVSRQVLDLIGNSSWQSYSALRAHATAIAASRAFVQVVSEEKLVDRARALSPVITARMALLAERHPIVQRTDGMGLHWWIDLHPSAAASGPDSATQVAAAVLDAGVMVATSGEASAILITLPMIISDDQLETVFQALDHGLRTASAACR
jgi:4-aminobutyrate aminotransferase-like enzyme